MESLLKLEHVTICYNGEPVVHDVDLELNKGEILGVVGESGSGKSTIIKAIMGLLGNEGTVTDGDIWYKGKNVVDMPEKELRRLLGPEIAMVFQDSGAALCPIRTVGDQIYESMREHERISRKECAERAVRMMAKIGLKDGERVLQSYPFELSGGMQQRLNIALSLMFHPSLLIMDEATTALDVITQGQIIDELLELEKQFSITRIMITHDLSVVASSCKKILVMYAGRLVEYGNTNDILRKAMHPYTEGLIHSFPSLYGKKEQLKSIPGSLPDLSREHPGCIFAPRCSYATEKCFQTRPKTYTLNDTHRVSCHKYGENSNE